MKTREVHIWAVEITPCLQEGTEHRNAETLYILGGVEVGPILAVAPKLPFTRKYKKDHGAAHIVRAKCLGVIDNPHVTFRNS